MDLRTSGAVPSRGGEPQPFDSTAPKFLVVLLEKFRPFLVMSQRSFVLFFFQAKEISILCLHYFSITFGNSEISKKHSRGKSVAKGQWRIQDLPNNLLTFIISYHTINPVVLSVPLVSHSFTFPGLKPNLDVVLSPLLLPKSGTIYPLPLKSHHHLTPSNVTLKHTILPPHNFFFTT